METIAYTIAGATTEVSLGALGVGVSFHVKFGTHGESKITLPLAAIPPETAVAIPFECPCIIYTGRTGGPGTWSGGTPLFQGRRTDNSGRSWESGAAQELIIEDAWYDLRFLTMQAAWENITGFSGTTPAYGSPNTWPDCVLFQASPQGQLQPNGTFAAYAPAPAYGHITTGQAIQEMLAYAISIGGVNLRIGQIDPAIYVPFYPVRAMRIADCIKIALRAHTDCACEIDHTTTPPTFNVRKLANLVPITLPYKSTIGNQIHLTSDVRPRPDLIPSRVGIYIKSTATVSGTPVVSIGTDIYPAAAATGLRSLDVSVDMTGSKLAKTSASLSTAAFNPTNLSWWAQKVPALQSQAYGGQIPNSGGGALALLDSTINGGTSGHPKGIQVVDDNGNPVNLSIYAYELLTGTPCSWMQSTGGGAVTWIEANVIAFFAYNKVTTAGSASMTDKIGEHMHTCRVKLINTASATFSLSQILATGETYPAGLAQAIYTALQPLQYNFTHTIQETPFATVVKPGKHCLNLVGGAVAWETMAAMVQAVEMDITFSPGTGQVTAKTTVKCGPVEHLEAGELVQILNLFTNRDLSKINPSERSGGYDQSGGVTTLGSDSPKENSVPADAVHAIKNFTATDATQGTLTNILVNDATQGQITRLQQYSGATIQTGIIAPVYSASGAPSSSTLPANSYYRVGDQYVDTSANALYRCTTAGTYNVGHTGGSAWIQLGGGSVQQFKLAANGGVIDAGDYWWAQSWDGTTQGSTYVKIAKPYKIRAGTGGIGSETIAGVTHTYTYTYDGGNAWYYRTDAGSDSSNYTAYIMPPALSGDIIYVLAFATTGPSSLSGVTMIDLNLDRRGWATQT